MNTDEVLKALSNPHRRLMLNWLKSPRDHFPPPLPAHAELPGACATYIFEKSGLAQATASQYLSQLESVGLVVRSRHGRWTFYRRDEAAISRAIETLKSAMGAT